MKSLSFFDKIIFLLNTVFAVVFAISLLLPFIPTTVVPSLSVVSLVVQFLVFLNFIFAVYWLFRKKRQFLLSGVLLVLWYLTLGPFYRFSGKQGEKEDREKGLSIMTFNVRSFNELKQLKVENADSLIYDLITKQDPDIVCFQETFYALKRSEALSQYRYKFVDFIYGKRKGKVIQSIYSKYPLLQIDSINFPESANTAIYADILFGKDTVRVYNVHLQSFRIVPGLNTITNEESSRLFSRSKKVMLKQYEQANLVRDNMAATSHKKIVVGDFNNTQYSNVYRTIKGNMKDSYVEKGSGFGMTYDLLGFPIRIDYILTDSDFEVLSHQNFREKLSDHYPVMATLKLSSQQ